MQLLPALTTNIKVNYLIIAGDIINGNINGIGSLKFNETNEEYIGEFKDNQICGKGRLKTSNT